MTSCPPRRAWFVGLALAGAYLLTAFFLLDDYGPTWDSVAGEYIYGERLVEYALTGDPDYLRMKDVAGEPPVREPHLRFCDQRFEWNKVRMVGAIGTGIACRVLWTQLG